MHLIAQICQRYQKVIIEMKKTIIDGLNAIYTGFNFAKQYICYSSSFHRSRKKSIALNIHSIEKGLSTKAEEFRTEFGKNKIKELEDDIELVGDSYYESWGRELLRVYDGVNKEGHLSDRESDIGSIKIEENDYVNMPYQDMMSTRHSCRYFKNQTVDSMVLIKAMDVARLSPSACNRQAVHIYAVRDKETIKKLSKIQNGHKGSENAPCWLIVTGNLSMYGGSELKMALVDCGIFTMNLLLALNTVGLECCCLHGCMRQNKENMIKKICGIPKNEMISNFVMTGYGDYESRSPVSKRKPGDMLITFCE